VGEWLREQRSNEAIQQARADEIGPWASPLVRRTRWVQRWYSWVREHFWIHALIGLGVVGFVLLVRTLR